MEKYIYRNGKKLKYGFTTGTCAAAATKAAIQRLLTGEIVNKVQIQVPKGWVLNLKVELTEVLNESILCCIRKDAGDDPDVTDGLLICSKVRLNKKNVVIGGVGVGKVTKEGLPVPLGKAAINPVPMQMIFLVLDNFEGHQFHVEITVPEGELIAKKTFNPKLGILNGISILGTSGIVEPMSLEALKDSLMIEFNQMKNHLDHSIVFCPGNYGKDYAKTLLIHEKYILKISNYVGFFLNRLVEHQIKDLLFIGHIGKLIKIAAGNFNTHSKISDARMETLVAYGALHGASQKTLKKAFNAVTTDAAIEHLLKEVDKTAFFQDIVNQIQFKMESHVYKALHIEVILFSNKHGFLGQTKGAMKLINENFTGN